MVKLAEHLCEMEKVRGELSRCKPNTPHYRDTAKRYKRLMNEYRQAVAFARGKNG